MKKEKKVILENKVKEFRKQLGLSQVRAAENSLVERTRFQRIESHKVMPTREEMEFIAEALASTVEGCFPPEGTASSGSDEGKKNEEPLDASGSVFI